MKKSLLLGILSSAFIAMLVILFILIIVGLIYENSGESLPETITIVSIIFIVLGGLWGFSYKIGS
jgi:hypothetical protein